MAGTSSGIPDGIISVSKESDAEEQEGSIGDSSGGLSPDGMMADEKERRMDLKTRKMDLEDGNAELSTKEVDWETKFSDEKRVLLRKYSNTEYNSIEGEEQMEWPKDETEEGKTSMMEGSEESGGVYISSLVSDEIGAEEEGDTIIAPPSNYDSLANLIDKMLDEIEPYVSSEYCIYRVPQKIRKLNEEAYNPHVVSIGPFHHGDERFRSMEAFKKRYFKKLVRRDNRVSLKNYIEFLKDCEASARQCYSKIIEMSSDDFVTMMLVDGCFIIELLLTMYYSDWGDAEHSKLSSLMWWNELGPDLILLENQLPFFVLEGLFNLAMMNYEPFPLLDLALNFFDDFNVQKKPPDFTSIKHFTDLILKLHRPTSRRRVKEFQYASSATELHEAGVKFRMGSSTCLLDIKFSDGVLEIPRITLDDKTELIIRNLMALECCHYPHDSYMIDYFFFMDFLLDTPKDVDLLIQNGIIENRLGDSKEAANLFNNMNKNCAINDKNFYFSGLCEELKAYCKVPRHKWKSTLKRNYFSSPWRTASTFAAIVLLVLTFIQTVCSVLGASKGK